MANPVAVAEGITVDHTASGAVAANSVVEMTGCIGIAREAIADTEVGPVVITGRWTLDKETGVVFTSGDLLFWDATNDRLDKTATNIYAGICAADAATGATSADVILNLGSTLLA